MKTRLRKGILTTNQIKGLMHLGYFSAKGKRIAKMELKKRGH